MIRESGGIAMEVKDINQIKEVFDRIDEDANIYRV
jgi:chaperonin cofactor prefoldin